MKKMTLTVLTLVVFAAAAAAQNGAKKSAAGRAAAELIALKRSWGKIYVERDRAALERLLAKEYTVTGEDGATTGREAILADFAASETIYESAAYEDARVSFYGTVAIVAGRGVVKGRGKSGAFHTEYFSTNIFVRRSGRWQAVATHISGSKRL